eukprot:4969727-Pleurochrysis_carterae.AAC.1
MRGVNCQVSRTGGRPTRVNLPTAKNVTPYILSHTLAKQVYARVSPAINNNKSREADTAVGVDWQALNAKWAILGVGSSASGGLLVRAIVKLFLFLLAPSAMKREQTLTNTNTGGVK